MHVLHENAYRKMSQYTHLVDDKTSFKFKNLFPEYVIYKNGEYVCCIIQNTFMVYMILNDISDTQFNDMCQNCQKVK